MKTCSTGYQLSGGKHRRRRQAPAVAELPCASRSQFAVGLADYWRRPIAERAHVPPYAPDRTRVRHGRNHRIVFSSSAIRRVAAFGSRHGPARGMWPQESVVGSTARRRRAARKPPSSPLHRWGQNVTLSLSLALVSRLTRATCDPAGVKSPAQRRVDWEVGGS
jgi:hypothetical protein